MNQSKAKPKRPRPVASDLIFIVSVAVQPAPQGVLLARPLTVDLRAEDKHPGLPVEPDLASGNGAARGA
jgi:hypothetical protein